MDKKRLERYRELVSEQKEILDMVGEIEAVVLSPKGQKIDGMPHSPTVSDNTAMINKWIDLKNKYVAKTEEILDELDAIEGAIQNLRPTERAVIREKYVLGKTYDKIGRQLGYDERHIRRIAERAIAKMQGY